MRTIRRLMVGALLAAFGCQPSQAELATRESGRAAVAELRAAADAHDAAFRQSLARFDAAAAGACDPSGIRKDAAATGQPPTNFAEYRREEDTQIRPQVTSQVRLMLARATALLDDEEERFRWANGREVAEEARALLSSSAYELVLVADMRAPLLGAETYKVDRLRGVLVGWSPERRAIVCGAAFDAEPPGRLTVGDGSATSDAQRTINYKVREVAFAAAGFGKVEPTRYGAPSLF
ncbi:MAG: hypothetical protein MUC96_13890 [Myxococcaceae bacterium]|jgi:hypothetical protein|nr:hypothetical protein [Myxococcaceae bacterium]